MYYHSAQKMNKYVPFFIIEWIKKLHFLIILDMV